MTATCAHLITWPVATLFSVVVLCFTLLVLAAAATPGGER